MEFLSPQLIFLRVRAYQRENQESHERIEKRVVESHDLLAESLTDNGLLLDSISDRLDTSHDLLAQVSTDHALQLDSVVERLDTSQARIESQLQAILANQQRSKTPILSQSLDASSPEGRQTWMELGRLLRDEGITPAMVQSNRGLLIDAMKNTLKNKSLLAESASESYATAPEYQVDKDTTSVSQLRNTSHLDLPTVSYPMSLLGSAPPRSSGFTPAFLERHHGSSLDQRQNVDDGMQSLLQGMNNDDTTPESQLGDGEHVQSEEMSFKRIPINSKDSGSRSSQKPLRGSKPKTLAKTLELPVRSTPIEDPPLCSNETFLSKHSTSTSLP